MTNGFIKFLWRPAVQKFIIQRLMITDKPRCPVKIPFMSACKGVLWDILAKVRSIIGTRWSSYLICTVFSLSRLIWQSNHILVSRLLLSLRNMSTWKKLEITLKFKARWSLAVDTITYSFKYSRWDEPVVFRDVKRGCSQMNLLVFEQWAPRHLRIRRVGSRIRI